MRKKKQRVLCVFLVDGPIFQTKPKSVEADISGTVSFSCDVDGNPSPDILWIHEANDRVSNLCYTYCMKSSKQFRAL